MVTSRENMFKRAVTSAAVAPTIEDRLRHARELAPSHPVDESHTQAQVQVAPVVTQPGTYQVGSIPDVPLSLVRENPMNARVFYPNDEVGLMAVSLAAHGQDVPAKGYFDTDEGVVILVDGQKRLRAAKAGGLSFLRVDICEKPVDEKTVFLTSRRINRERSSQTCLDDAVRFKHLLESGIYSNQEDLAAAVEMSQPMVSRTVALTLIPERVMRRMKDHAFLTGIVAAHAISDIFKAEKFVDNQEEAYALADKIIDEIVKGEISGKHVKTLVDSRLAGPVNRVRNDSRKISYGGVQGVIKTNADKGLFELSIKGLSPEKVEELRKKIEGNLEL